MDGVRRALAGGKLSAREAAALSKQVANTVRTAKPAGREQRLRALESRLAQMKERSRPVDRFGA